MTELPHPSVDIDQACRFLTLITEKNLAFEIRAMPGTYSGYNSLITDIYVDADQGSKALDYAENKARPKAIYVTMNPVSLARYQESEDSPVNISAKKKHITKRRWMLIDIDAERDKGVNSSEEELQAARSLADEIHEYLTAKSFAEPLRVMSGNGYHLLYPIDLPTDDMNCVKYFLKVIASKFNNNRAAVDTVVFDAVRITKIAGTWARKGPDETERPHRMVMWENQDCPRGKAIQYDDLQSVIKELGGTLAKTLPVETPKKARSFSLPQLDLIESGCSFMKHCHDDAATLAEPHWFAMCTIAARCEDGRDLTHQWSADYPQYNENETDKKIDRAMDQDSPVGCKYIQGTLGYEGCQTCPHRGATQSPLELGQNNSESKTLQPYDKIDGEFIYYNLVRQTTVAVPLSNFTAEITHEVIKDDGTETTRSFVVKVRTPQYSCTVTVEASEFDDLKWVTTLVGCDAVIYAAPKAKDHLQVAIKLTSDHKQYVTCYTTTGWRQINDQWIFLHQGGAIASTGLIDTVQTTLPDPLQPVVLEVRDGDARRDAVRASLELLEVGTDDVMVPLLGGVYRSVLGRNTANLHLVGRSGVFKSAIAVIIQAHFGCGFTDATLPASWKDTCNSLMMKAFHAKDILMVVDEFKPVGSEYAKQAMNKAADDLLRGNANGAGRGRLTRDATLRSTKPPQALILSTGEATPSGHSLGARLWEIEVREGDIQPDPLTLAQQRATQGLYAQAIGSYIQWLCGRYDSLQTELPNKLQDVRAQLNGGGHRRVSELGAQLIIGWDYFLEFALEVEAVTPEVCEALRERVHAVIKKQTAEQAEQCKQADPTKRFLELLSTVLSTGSAHVVTTQGREPANPGVWGWRQETSGFGNVFKAQGNKIGWLSPDDDLYLNMDATLKAIQRVADPNEDATVTNAKMIPRLLHEAGLLASTDIGKKGRNTHAVRVTCQGTRQNVVHLRADDVQKTDGVQPQRNPLAVLPVSGRVDSTNGRAI